MANGWVWSLQCRSRALDDVHNPIPMRLLSSSSSSCRSMSFHSVRDSIKPAKPLKPAKAKAPKAPKSPRAPRQIVSNRHPLHCKSEPGPNRSRQAPDPLLPAMKELPEGHPSRNVVEIIFHTSWSPKAFLGRVEMIFKVQNPVQTVARFEEYRETVKARAGSDPPCGGDGGWDDRARCLADGNELMQFHCMGAGAGTGGDCSVAVARAFPGVGGKGAAICTFSGSGAAHERAGGGRGRRTMLVCRVVAGRVCKKLGPDSFAEGRLGFDSVSGVNSELFVFDSRAVLPCFLIIYKL